MSKQQAENTWTKGLNKDINPNITPNDVLTDNLNGTFITYNGNEFSLQNDMGNVYTTKLTDGFYPIGMTEYGGIVYIVSVSSSIKKYLCITAKEGKLYDAVYKFFNEMKLKDSDFTFTDAQKAFTEKGLPVTSTTYETHLAFAIGKCFDDTLFEEYKWRTLDGTQLEIGSFPSLEPENISALELDKKEETVKDFEYIYRPLHNLITSNFKGVQYVSPFRTDALSNYDTEHPVTIEVQPSYDGSVNLILNDDKNPPRLINSGFAVIENNKGKFTKRNQDTKTNYYEEDKLETESLLINTSYNLTTVDLGVYEDAFHVSDSNKMTDEEKELLEKINAIDFDNLTLDDFNLIIEWGKKYGDLKKIYQRFKSNGTAVSKTLSLRGVSSGGQLKGGNYTFYFKYGDDDGNQTDIICESGIVSVFKGTVGVPHTISGAFQDEETDKMIHLTLNEINTNYSKLYVYYTREYCDSNGIRTYECKAIQEPYKIEQSTEDIVITGLEITEDISIEDLNVYYHTVASAKTSAQQQNMLFLGNITSENTVNANFQKYSYDIEVVLQQSEDIGSVSVENYGTSKGSEYYDPYNIYYKLGYWPNEIYRLGIVYIKSDGSTTQAYNLKGCEFKEVNESNKDEGHINNSTISEDGIFINNTTKMDNLKGVFKLPNVNILSEDKTCPLYFRFIIDEDTYKNLTNLGVIGYFIVRQKRLPITICQGFGIGVDKHAYIPMIYSDANSKKVGYVAESFLSQLPGVDSIVDYSTYCHNNNISVDDRNLDTQCNWYLYNISKLLGLSDVITSIEDSRILAEVNKLMNYTYTSINDPNLLRTIVGRGYASYTSAFAKGRLAIAKWVYELLCNSDDATINTEKSNVQLLYYPLSVENSVSTIQVNDEASKKYYIYVEEVKKKVARKNNNVYKYYASLIGPKDTDTDHVWYTTTEWGITGDKNASTAKNHAIEDAKSWWQSHCNELTEKYGGSWSGITEASSKHLNRDNVHLIENLDITCNRRRTIAEENAQLLGQGLLSVEAMTNYRIQSTLNGSEYYLSPVSKCKMFENWPVFYATKYDSFTQKEDEAKVVYVPEKTALKYFDKVGFSTLAGDGVNPDQFKCLVNDNPETDESDLNVIRGEFTPFIGVYTKDDNCIEKSIGDNTYKTGLVQPNCLYDIRVKHSDTYKNEIIARANNQDSYFAITDRTALINPVDAYRGDCFVNTVTVRMHRNFIDETVPTAETIVDPDCWKNYYHGVTNILKDGESNKKKSGEEGEVSDKDEQTYTEWDKINIGDLNTVSLGHWVTFKCLASSNLGLRSEDTSNTTERVQLGNSRGFYPFSGLSTATGMKLPDSTLLNDGYNATVGRKRYTLKQDTPYDKNEYDTRIIFSNVAVNDSFTNGYRTFQGASYHDYTKQYGSIVKLISFGNNLFCAFEHGLAIIPVNEKALIQTTTEQSIHIYGHGVLPDTLSVISQDLGSIWADSIIRTPMGIYGVDTSCKKIWQYTDKSGLRTLSDMTVQRFLNDNINLNLARQESLGLRNVKTHYNNYKGDVMFTFYNDDKQWNLCYNERQDLWVTRYDWIPLFSVNIDNSFYSLPLVSGVDLSESIGIWKHGRTGTDKQILPTKWYGEQHPFEYEFVVNTPAGVHKIFENLAIMSNNVQPVEIDFEFVGDAYLFNKARIYHDASNLYGLKGEDKAYIIEQEGFNKDNYAITDFTPMFKNATVNYDHVLDEYTIAVKQTCKNKESCGLRLGNIQYKEDCWFTNIEPLRYNLKLNSANYSDLASTDVFGSAKLRDKWIKIKIKYAGDKLAIVNGVVTNENISYA